MQLNMANLNTNWATEMLFAMEQSFDKNCADFPADPPSTPSEWYHLYYCDKCGVVLTFNVHTPGAHTCSACKTVYTGQPFDGCWAKMMNAAIVANMETAAVLALARPDNGRYLDYIRRNFLYYAGHYSEYSLKDRFAGTGKVFPQGLSEAIFIIAMERILRLVKDFSVFSAAEYKLIQESLFREAAKLLEPQIGKIHNIHAWMQASVAACANVLHDKEMMERSIYGEFGWINQIEKGCRKDGMWYEISPTYHFYTMKALLSHVWVAKDLGIDLSGHSRLRQMGEAALLLAYPNSEMPAYNDCHCNSKLAVSIYEQLNALLGGGFESTLITLYAANTGNTDMTAISSLPNPCPIQGNFDGRDSVFALFAPDLPSLPKDKSMNSESALLADSGIAILQNDALRVAVKATKYGGGHDHNDKISIDIFDKIAGRPISYDTGTSGYGIDFTKDWNRALISHNTVVVNGEKQQPSDAQIVLFKRDCAVAVADSPYEGVSMEREIHLLGNGFTDCFRISCEDDSTIDYVFHCVGAIKTCKDSAFTRVDEPLYPANGYPMLWDLRKLETADSLTLLFEDATICNKLHLEGHPGTTIIVGGCYGENMLVKQSLVIVRRVACQTAFSLKFTLSGGIN